MFRYLRERNARRKLKKLLQDYELPSFPALVTQVLQQLRDPDATARSIAQSVVLDPGLSVKVLRTVNSAAFSPRRPVSDLSQAVVLLGLSNLEAIVFGIAVHDVLPGQCQLDMCAFWRTSARRAAMARSLAQRIHPATHSLSFTAGLLQDMAMPLLAAARPQEYATILESAGGRTRELLALERRSLGYDHAQVAGLLCAEWDLPESLSAAIAGHHHPPGQAEGCPEAVAIVSGLQDHHRPEDAASWLAAHPRTARLGDQRLVELTEHAWEEAEELASLLG